MPKPLVERAIEGSPHPKEPKWWPGSQPRFEGGEAGAPVAAAEEVVEEAVVEEAPAVEAAPEPVVAEPVAAPEPTPAPTPAEAAPAAAAPAAAVATAPPSGVTHGTPSGNRMRPEDGVATQAQLSGQQAMYERRKLIDELVSSGVPTIAAQDAMKPRAPFLAILYVIIPILAVFILLAQEDVGGGEAAPAPEGEGGGIHLVAENVAFDHTELVVTAGEEAAIEFENPDSVEHNLAVYPDADSGIAKTDAIFQGEIIPAGGSTTYNVTAVDAGEYYFQCDVHPNMNGSYVAE